MFVSHQFFPVISLRETPLGGLKVLVSFFKTPPPRFFFLLALDAIFLALTRGFMFVASRMCYNSLRGC